MLDGVTVRVEQRGVPVADGLVAFCPVVGQANVSAEHVQAAIVTRQDQERCLSAVAVVAFAILGEVHDECVVEHAAAGPREWP